MTTPATTGTQVTGWDRAAVIALGAAGCALSYDALRQTAVAIHVRGWLTYLFPLVIDGFIAYGIRALLVLRTAPLRARFYVWTLFGCATTASLWANALHAVRLNQQYHQPGLSLGDTAVGILSTLAPLALAGAVHLYILVARNTAAHLDRPGQADQEAPSGPGRDGGPDSPPAGQVDVTRLSAPPRPTDWNAEAPVIESAEEVDGPQAAPGLTAGTIQPVRAGQPGGRDNSTGQSPAAGQYPAVGQHSRSGQRLAWGTDHRTAPGDRSATLPVGAGQPGHVDREHTRSSAPDTPVTAGRNRPQHRPVTRPGQPDRSFDLRGQQPVGTSDGPYSGPMIHRSPIPVSVPAIRPVTGHHPSAVTDQAGRPVTDRRSGQGIEDLLPIARAAVDRAGRVTRAVVGQAIRGQAIPLSSDRLTVLMARLRADKASGQQATATADPDSDLGHVDGDDHPTGQPGDSQDSGTVA